MAENTLLQSHSGIGIGQEWDESRHGRSENEHRSTQHRSNINYGEGQQQDYNREANRWYENNPGSYSGRESYAGNYGQHPYSAEQNRGYAQNAGYGQSGQNWNRNYENPYYPGQQRSYEHTNYGQSYQPQNWNPEFNRGYYSENRINPQSTSYAPASWEPSRGYQPNIGQQYNQGGYSNYGNAGSSYGGGYGQTAGAGWGQGYGSEYSRGNIGSTPFSSMPNESHAWNNSGAGWQGANDSNRYGANRGKGPRGYQRSDERIKEDVNDRLSDDNLIDASDIEVSLQSGEVILKGTVDSREAKRRAEDLAESVSGVHNVENHLRVKQNYPSPTGRWEDMNTDRSSVSTSSERTNSKTSRSAS